MFTEERHQRIITELEHKGRVEVGELARLLEVSEATIRRDIIALADQGYLQKTHGGAVSLNTMLLGWKARAPLHSEAKTYIGKMAAKLVQPGQTIILDAGSTTLQVARHLEARPITIITNSLDIANVLEASPGVTLLLTGGEWDAKVRHLNGAATLATLALYRADWVFLGVSGVHTKAGITSAYSENSAVKRSMIAASERVVVLADSSKLEQIAPHFVAKLQDIYAVVTDDKKQAKALEKTTKVILVDQS